MLKERNISYMKPTERDLSTLQHIIKHCNDISDALINHKLTLDIITNDSLYKNALAMSILQIGELVNILSEDFRKAHKTIPWHEIKRMRDKAAHHYWTFDVNILWETIIDDIKPLKRYCQDCINEYNINKNN